jgi:hypothetical protein
MNHRAVRSNNSQRFMSDFDAMGRHKKSGVTRLRKAHDKNGHTLSGREKLIDRQLRIRTSRKISPTPHSKIVLLNLTRLRVPRVSTP